ncbi:MAG: right-handed parallel beta-helix repeat-containing protein [Acidobacteria bacterium]|nr:right-handed parallel beta-helix repeat-containing protein [Acidobacteriota bacterium]
MTFEAATSGTVIVSGADVWTGWTPDSGNPQVFTHFWPYQYGLCPATPQPAPIQQDILLRREMLAVNGVSLTQVLSLSALQPGTFYVNEGNSQVYVRPPAGTNMATATVEVATRPTLFNMTNSSNIVLRGLTFEYSNACRQNSALLIYGADNILLDQDFFYWNNSIGVDLDSSRNFTVQNSVANHNGQKGFHTTQVKQNLWQSDTASYNNWRGAQGVFYGWDTGGAKFMLNHGGTFKNLSMTFNQSHGIHFDTDNENISVNSVIMANNVESFLVEKSQGPTSVSNSYLCSNGLIGLGTDGGLVIRDSPNLTMSANQIRGNSPNQIVITGVAGGIVVPNWETGSSMNLVTEKFTSTGNTINGSSSTQLFKDGYLGSTDWTLFVTTLNSDNNHWYSGSNLFSFTVPVGGQHTLDFSGWQKLTAQDLQSSWANTAVPAQCNVIAQAPDYWLLSGNTFGVTIDSTRHAVFNLSTVALGGMTGTVNLTADISSIPGAQARFNSASLPTNGQTQLTLTTSSSTRAGKYPFTVVANSGSMTRTVTLMLMVP